MSVTFPNESLNYRNARTALLDARWRCDGKWKPSQLN